VRRPANQTEGNPLLRRSGSEEAACAKIPDRYAAIFLAITPGYLPSPGGDGNRRRRTFAQESVFILEFLYYP